MIDVQGVSVIMGAGGLTGSAGTFLIPRPFDLSFLFCLLICEGILRAAQRGIFVTGVDADEYFGIFAGQPQNVTKFLLTSWTKQSMFHPHCSLVFSNGL